MSTLSADIQLVNYCMYVRTVSLTLNLTHACVCTRTCTHLTHVKVNNLVCIINAAREFGVHTNARGTLDMHHINMPVTCARFATVSNTCALDMHHTNMPATCTRFAI